MKTAVLALCMLSTAVFGRTACTWSRLAPLRTEPRVDLQAFMGDWYVMAHIPTFIQKVPQRW